VLVGLRYLQRGQEPQVDIVSHGRENRRGNLFSDNCIYRQWQVGAVLFDGPDGQNNYRIGAEGFSNLRSSQILESS
tara:strand:+ start:254 stop:481 length:228 start_codon:yes stop_codon:yes gene_type:complete